LGSYSTLIRDVINVIITQTYSLSAYDDYEMPDKINLQIK